jgi:hypothetical protein
MRTWTTADHVDDVGLNSISSQTIQTCLSTARPPSPTVGACIYETDTGRDLVYTGPVIGWSQPWNLPWGWIDGDYDASDSFTWTSPGVVDLGLERSGAVSTAKVPLVKNRRYRLNVYCGAVSQSAAVDATHQLSVELWQGATQRLARRLFWRTGWYLASYTADGLDWHYDFVWTNNTDNNVGIFFNGIVAAWTGGANFAMVRAAGSFKWGFQLFDIGPGGNPP